MKRQIVLVTGSRDWTDYEAVRRRLSRYPHGSILIHGDCPTGADMAADQYGRDNSWHVLPVPYFEATDGNDNRNALLVAVAAAFVGTPLRRKYYEVTVEAFPPIENRPSGTRNCIRLAKEAGLRVEERERT